MTAVHRMAPAARRAHVAQYANAMVVLTVNTLRGSDTPRETYTGRLLTVAAEISGTADVAVIRVRLRSGGLYDQFVSLAKVEAVEPWEAE